jgi:signal transduction histidine kinase
MTIQEEDRDSPSPVAVADRPADCTKSLHTRSTKTLPPFEIRGPVGQSLALVAAVFTVDLCLPLGVASAVPYTFAVLIALRSRPRWFGPGVAALCMVLTVAKMGLVPERGTTEMWKVVVNRCLALFAIGMTTFLGVRRRRSDDGRERALEQLREHQAALAQMGRLSLLGQITAGLAHEINQPLAAVRLNAELAERHVARDPAPRPELSEAIREVVSQSARAGEIVHSIRRLARRSTPIREPVPLNDVIADAVRLLDWPARRAGVGVVWSRGPTSEIAFGDRTQIEQVLLNLIQNAIEALAESDVTAKVVRIRVAREGGMIVVRVCDNGPGWPAGAPLFEAFYTTKREGLGLGLAICRGLVEAHGGRIAAEWSKGGGTEFSFSLPSDTGDDP